MAGTHKPTLLDWRKAVDLALGSGFAAIGALEIKHGQSIGGAVVAFVFSLGFGVDFVQTIKRLAQSRG
jgi:hypothetical protein